jgi:hypothetical protein
MSTKTAQKNTAKTKEFNLTPVLTMWIYKGKNDVKYLSGKTPDGVKLKGFFNGKKKNPKEPDIRIYTQLDKGVLSKDEFISLWVKVSKGGKKYISGKLGDKWVTGFFNAKAEIGGIIPYINVYFSNNDEKTDNVEALKPDVPEGVEEIETDDDLPF